MPVRLVLLTAVLLSCWSTGYSQLPDEHLVPGLPQEHIPNDLLAVVWINLEKVNMIKVYDAVDPVVGKDKQVDALLKKIQVILGQLERGKARHCVWLIRGPDAKGDWPAPILMVQSSTVGQFNALDGLYTELTGITKVNQWKMVSPFWVRGMPAGSSYQAADAIDVSITQSLLAVSPQAPLRMVLTPTAHWQSWMMQQVTTRPGKEDLQWVISGMVHDLTRCSFATAQAQFGIRPGLQVSLHVRPASEATALRLAQQARLKLLGQATDTSVPQVLVKALAYHQQSTRLQLVLKTDALRLLFQQWRGRPIPASRPAKQPARPAGDAPKVGQVPAKASLLQSSESSGTVGGSSTLDSARQIQLLLTGIRAYAMTHDGQFPKKLDDLKEVFGAEGLNDLLTHPQTGKKPGYLYVQPGRRYDKIQRRSATALIYEQVNGQRDPADWVGYLDGSVRQRVEKSAKD